jgi:hypothetical protein
MSTQKSYRRDISLQEKSLQEILYDETKGMSDSDLNNMILSNIDNMSPSSISLDDLKKTLERVRILREFQKERERVKLVQSTRRRGASPPREPRKKTLREILEEETELMSDAELNDEILKTIENIFR